MRFRDRKIGSGEGRNSERMFAAWSTICDVVRVPIHGRAESLNLAMAATVCLYASAGQRPGARSDG